MTVCLGFPFRTGVLDECLKTKPSVLLCLGLKSFERSGVIFYLCIFDVSLKFNKSGPRILLVTSTTPLSMIGVCMYAIHR